MSESSVSEVAATTPAVRKRSWAPLWALLLALAGIALYMLMFDLRWMRTYSILPIALMLAGSIVGINSLFQRRTIARIGATVVCVALLSMQSLIYYGGLAGVPAAASIANTAVSFPAFSLPNQRGETVTAEGYLAKGPLLLMFYRGHW